MEAHKVLKDAGYTVRSYGTGTSVRLPGPTIDQPNVFEFGTPYTKILEKLNTQDLKIHKANGVLDMTKRNIGIKKAPERWPYYNQPPQRLPPSEYPEFENELDFQVVITCEERCFDSVVEDFFSRNYFEPSQTQQAVHCFNVEIRDEHKSALAGAQAILDLARMLSDAHAKSLEDFSAPLFEDKIPDIITEWQQNHPVTPVLYALCYH
ncbi:hypothetical protein KL905_001751 [Ogataea polymorpha]|nr:hypothetical protein KL935_000328 [Ogataea polymorpha]KAG7908310.1 hypothetical protein KL907_001800 [Ogataea polymorpha]KAG7908960.1 hypothetical protein KL906_003191 [Ogataea polymorpha]KAG7921079.1 hypothetical protein KL927_000323 [Ogataea polymorpha]KAG7922530.1 hypothetical protein KL905_001751 [Ogataea polymorpha]